MARTGNKSYNGVNFEDAIGTLTLTKDEIIFLGKTEELDSKPRTRAWEWDSIADCCVDFFPQADEAVWGKPKRCLHIQLAPTKKDKAPKVVHLHVPDQLIHEVMAVVEPHLVAAKRKRRAEKKAARREARKASLERNTKTNATSTEDSLARNREGPAQSEVHVKKPTKNGPNALGSHSERGAGARQVGVEVTHHTMSQSDRPARRTRGRSITRTKKEAATAETLVETVGSRKEKPPRSNKTRRNSLGATKTPIKEMGSKSERTNRTRRERRNSNSHATDSSEAEFSVAECSEEMEATIEMPGRIKSQRRYSLPSGKLENKEGIFSPSKLFGNNYTRLPRDETKKPFWRVF